MRNMYNILVLRLEGKTPLGAVAIGSRIIIIIWNLRD
jgi:hypothetical protein